MEKGKKMKKKMKMEKRKKTRKKLEMEKRVKIRKGKEKMVKRKKMKKKKEIKKRMKMGKGKDLFLQDICIISSLLLLKPCLIPSFSRMLSLITLNFYFSPCPRPRLRPRR